MDTTLPLYFILVLLVTNLTVYGQGVPASNDPKRHPARTNNSFVALIDGKPIDYYLKHGNIGQTAKMFYKGQWAISDDKETFAFLDSALTDDTDTRPFYSFVVNQVMRVSDGAVSEHVSAVCREFLVRYPCEFVRMSRDEMYNVDVDRWTAFIGFSLYDSSDYQTFVEAVERKIKRGCRAEMPEWERLRSKVRKKIE